MHRRYPPPNARKQKNRIDKAYALKLSAAFPVFEWGRGYGLSRAPAVGPVAVVSLMTVAAIGNLSVQSTAEYITAAIALAALSGLFFMLMGILRLGALSNFLSHHLPDTGCQNRSQSPGRLTSKHRFQLSVGIKHLITVIYLTGKKLSV